MKRAAPNQCRCAGDGNITLQARVCQLPSLLPTRMIKASGLANRVAQRAPPVVAVTQAADSLNTVPIGADTSHHTFLTTPQHA